VAFTNDSLREVKSGINLFESQAELHKIFDKRIKIRGIFDSRSHGHLGQYFGAINEICYLEIL
jgi:hypothetical protein